MSKFEKVDEKLNKSVVLSYLHDMEVVNLKIYEGKIKMRISLFKWVDNLNKLDLVKNDDERGIVEVVFDDVKIKDFIFDGRFDARFSSILNFGEMDGSIYLSLDNSDDNVFNYIDMLFEYRKYRWKVITVISKEEYYSCQRMIKTADDDTKLPSWFEF